MSGPLESSVTLDEVISIARTKRVPLAPELAGYLALETCEAAVSHPGSIAARDVYISEEGSVAVVQRASSSDERPVDSVRMFLRELLAQTGSQTPALSAVCEDETIADLSQLARRIETALIPLNRGAGRRALARLARDVKRVALGVGRNASIPPTERGPRASAPSYSDVGEPRSVPPPPLSTSEPEIEPKTEMRRAAPSRPADTLEPSAPMAPDPSAPTPIAKEGMAPAPRRELPQLKASGDDVDELLARFEVSDSRSPREAARELRSLAGLEPTPAPPPVDSDGDVDALLDMAEPPSPEPPPPELPRAFPPPNDALPIIPRPPRTPTDGPLEAALPRTRTPGAPAASPAPERAVGKFERTAVPHKGMRGRDIVLLIVLFVMLGVAGALVVQLKPWESKAPPAPAGADAHADAGALAACRLRLDVTDVPDDAEVFVKVGRAPLDVDHMPVGVRLEFLATAEGYAPGRAVIPKDADWESTDGAAPRFELAVQLDAFHGSGHKAPPWPPGEPGSEVGGSGPPGTVHIVSTPRGADAWLLVGLGPMAQIDALPCTGDVDVLVGSPAGVEIINVPKSSFGAEAGPDRLSATVSAKQPK